MKTRNWKALAGTGLHWFVGGIMILAGSMKVLGLFPPEQLAKNGLATDFPDRRGRAYRGDPVLCRTNVVVQAC